MTKLFRKLKLEMRISLCEKYQVKNIIFFWRYLVGTNRKLGGRKKKVRKDEIFLNLVG